jgi:hypothetical protein
MEDLVGKKMYGFKFSDGPGFNSHMYDLIGKEAEILEYYPDHSTCTVKFDKLGLWSYPYPEILDHLVEDERTIDELLSEIKQLTSQI